MSRRPSSDTGAKPDAERIAARVDAQLRKAIEERLAPGLYLVATPIGNLGDISLRAIVALASADVVFCEDTRRARKLLSHFGVARDVQVYEEHNAERVRPRVMEALRGGQSVALISDAGTPLISDPGFKLVRAAAEERISVFAVPGPVAAIAALTVSGLPSDRFLFTGFLPSKSTARRARLGELSCVEASLILYESAGRLSALLEDVEAMLGQRDVAVLREMTKRFEEHLRGTVSQVRSQISDRSLKGEVVVVVGPPADVLVSDERIAQRLDAAMASMSPRDAVQMVAESLGIQRKRVYDVMVGRLPAARR